MYSSFNSAVMLLEQTESKFPTNIALQDEDNSYTFSQIRSLSRSIGTSLIDMLGTSGKQPIGVFLPKSADCVVAFMGVLYSGNFYSPIDDNMPSARLEKLLAHLEPTIIITNNAYSAVLMELGFPQEKILIFEKAIYTISDSEKIDCALSNVIDLDPIYVLFTSGSTGVPKGVVVCHRSVVDYAHWLEKTFELSPNTIIGNQSSFYFDNTVLDIYAMIISGGKLIIISDILYQYPEKLINYIIEQEVTLIFWVPTVMISVANSGVLENSKFRSLRYVAFAGEIMPTRHINIWRKNHHDLLYVNMYGPTESTDICTYYFLDREFEDTEALPIGIPCENHDVFILNDKDEPAAIDEIGEICITGTGVAVGYYKDFEGTSKAFMQNPVNKSYSEMMYRTGDLGYVNSDGLIMIIGRKDSQIKHKGNRIELGEIETAAKSIADIQNACVLYDTDKEEIVMFYEAEKELIPRIIARDMRDIIPKYMIPTSFVWLEKLPLNANKKIDRRKLREYFANGG